MMVKKIDNADHTWLILILNFCNLRCRRLLLQNSCPVTKNDRIEMNKRICNILFFSFATSSDLLIQVQ